jgi:helicase MOV-10
VELLLKAPSLTVPGLAEKRPSVIVGDKVLVKHHGSRSTSWFRGYVHKVEQHRVGLRFSPSFNSIPGQKHDVRFCLGRIPLRRMHQALDSPFSPPRLLHPFDAHIIKKRPPTTQEVGALNVVDRKIGGNAMQKLAVTTIRDLQPGSPPFVVFGPYVSCIFHLRRISHTFVARGPERLSPSLRPFARYS